MNEPQKPSLVIPLLAGVLSLMGLPLGIGLFVIASREPADAWNEGGWPMYPVLSFAMASTVVGAVGAFFVARGKPVAWAVSACLSVFVAALGVFGYHNGLIGSFEAIQHASPLDRAVIMNASVGEASQCVVFALLLVAGILAVQGVALAFSGLAVQQPLERRGAFLLGFGVLAVGVWQAMEGFAFSAESTVYKGAAHGSPADRLTIIAGYIDEAGTWSQRASFALLAVVVVCVLAGTLLRSNPRVLISVVAGILIPTAGLGGARAFARPTAEQAELLAQPRTFKPLLELNATPVDDPYPYVSLGTELRDRNGELASLDGEQGLLAGRDGTFQLALEPNVTLATLEKMLRDLRAHDVKSVLLIGMKTTKPEGLTIPPKFAQHFTESRGVRVLLGRTENDCPKGGCTWATMDEKTLTFGEERWPLADQPFGYDDGEIDFARAVPFQLEGHTLQQFLSAAMTVGAQNPRRLALYFDVP
jgi:hypothetical protein